MMRKPKPLPRPSYFDTLWNKALAKINAVDDGLKDDLLRDAFGLAYAWYSLEGYKHVMYGKSCGCKACHRADRILEAAGVNVQPGSPERPGPIFVHN